MDRRKSLKLIATGVIATPAVIGGCSPEEKKIETKDIDAKFNLDRNPDELKYEKELLAEENFFTPHEMATISILADIILPKDEISGSASEAGVPAFIEFIVKDMPQHQVPLRGGIRWLDMQCLKKNNAVFKDCSKDQQMEIVNQIAYPEKAKAEMSQGVQFFNLLRNLTATGFYTSEMGIKDIGYIGNQPNKWNGVPDEVLAQYKLAYTEKELNECVKP
jgi:hypothetical protein